MNEWDLGRDQINKKDQGLPKPGEAYGINTDNQKSVEEIAREGLHEQLRGDTPVRRDDKRGRSSSGSERKSRNHAQGDDNDGDVFKGPIIHSSCLDRDDAPDFKDKTVAVIGSGASAVEAVETALAKGAKKCIVLARQDKVGSTHDRGKRRTDAWLFVLQWIIPRNIIIDTLVSAQPFGRETPLRCVYILFLDSSRACATTLVRVVSYGRSLSFGTTTVASKIWPQPTSGCLRERP